MSNSNTNFNSDDPITLRGYREGILNDEEEKQLINTLYRRMRTNKADVKNMLDQYTDGTLDQAKATQICDFVRMAEDSTKEEVPTEGEVPVETTPENKEVKEEEEVKPIPQVEEPPRTENRSSSNFDENGTDRISNFAKNVRENAEHRQKREEFIRSTNAPASYAGFGGSSGLGIGHGYNSNDFDDKEINTMLRHELERMSSNGVMRSENPIPFEEVQTAMNTLKPDEREGLKFNRSGSKAGLLNAMGGKYALNRIYNSLATAGSNNVSLSQAVIASLAATAYYSENEIFQMRNNIRRIIVDGNSYTPTLIAKASFSDRTQGTDVGKNHQGAAFGAKVDLTERSSVVAVDLSLAATNGDMATVVQQSVNEATAEDEDDAIATVVATATNATGLGASAAISSLTVGLLAKLKAQVKGGSRRAMLASQGVFDLVQATANSNVPIFPHSYAELGTAGVYSGIPGLRAILSDSLPTVADAETTGSAKTAFYVADIDNACEIAVNGKSARAGISYNHRAHAWEVYFHYARGVANKDVANMVTRARTKTA